MPIIAEITINKAINLNHIETLLFTVSQHLLKTYHLGWDGVVNVDGGITLKVLDISAIVLGLNISLKEEIINTNVKNEQR